MPRVDRQYKARGAHGGAKIFRSNISSTTHSGSIPARAIRKSASGFSEKILLSSILGSGGSLYRKYNTGLTGMGEIREMKQKKGKEKMERNTNFREEKREVVSTQIRLPAGMHEYIKREADRMGVAQNTFLIILLEQGRKLWEADVTHLREVK